MSDTTSDNPSAEPAPTPDTAGSLLRQARLAKGLHVAALATSIKVAPRKLELLEADRYDELPGATFTRALAQTVCRTLKIDATPVLALLPQPADQGLSQLSMGLNEPFRDKPGRRVPSDLSFLGNPIVIAALVLVVASVVLYLLPAGWVAQITGSGMAGVGQAEVPAPVPEAASVVVTLPPPVVAADSEALPVAPAASTAASSASAAPGAAEPSAVPASVAPVAPGGALLLRAQAQSWVEVIDGRGNPLMSRLLEAGEAVGLDGPTPLRVKIGNASATQVSFRGRPVELAPSRDNVAKLELR
ncbi:MAG TPA: helix-turn-helix domain-containing protein [Rhizobacter sp.]